MAESAKKVVEKGNRNEVKMFIMLSCMREDLKEPGKTFGTTSTLRVVKEGLGFNSRRPIIRHLQDLKKLGLLLRNEKTEDYRLPKGWQKSKDFIRAIYALAEDNNGPAVPSDQKAFLTAFGKKEWLGEYERNSQPVPKNESEDERIERMLRGSCRRDYWHFLENVLPREAHDVHMTMLKEELTATAKETSEMTLERNIDITIRALHGLQRMADLYHHRGNPYVYELCPVTVTEVTPCPTCGANIFVKPTANEITEGMNKWCDHAKALLKADIPRSARAILEYFLNVYGVNFCANPFSSDGPYGISETADSNSKLVQELRAVPVKEGDLDEYQKLKKKAYEKGAKK